MIDSKPDMDAETARYEQEKARILTHLAPNSLVHPPAPDAASLHAVYPRLTALEATQATQQARMALLEAQVTALQAQLDQRSARTRMRP